MELEEIQKTACKMAAILTAGIGYFNITSLTECLTEMDVGEDEATPNEAAKCAPSKQDESKNLNHDEEAKDNVQAQIVMDGDGNFQEQSIMNMQRAVYSGELSVSDYYTRKIDLRICEMNGVDDGHSCLKGKRSFSRGLENVEHVARRELFFSSSGLIPRIKSFSSNSNNTHRVWLCTTVDHYSSTYGDRGWGCGYRNIQMMLSSLIHHTGYNQKLFNGRCIAFVFSTNQPIGFAQENKRTALFCR